MTLYSEDIDDIEDEYTDVSMDLVDNGMYIYLSNLTISIHLFILVSNDPSIYPSIYSSIHPLVCLSIHLSIVVETPIYTYSTSIHWSSCPFIHPFIHIPHLLIGPVVHSFIHLYIFHIYSLYRLSIHIETSYNLVCEECEITDAAVKCSKCDCVYCQSCFQIVSSHLLTYTNKKKFPAS